jgi:hypothetical protein
VTKALLVLVVGLLLVTMVEAQTDSCNTPTPSTVQVRRTEAVRVGWCHSLLDADGQILPTGAVHFYLLDQQTNEVLMDLGTPVPREVTLNGMFYFESTEARTFRSDVSVVVIAQYASLASPPSPSVLIDVVRRNTKP